MESTNCAPVSHAGKAGCTSTDFGDSHRQNPTNTWLLQTWSEACRFLKFSNPTEHMTTSPFERENNFCNSEGELWTLVMKSKTGIESSSASLREIVSVWCPNERRTGKTQTTKAPPGANIENRPALTGSFSNNEFRSTHAQCVNRSPQETRLCLDSLCVEHEV